MGDPGGQLAERSHLLGLDQPRLGRLQVVIGGLGGVPGGADLRLRALALGDVAVNEDKAAVRHRVPADLDDPSVRARAFKAQLPFGIFDAAAQIRFEIGRDIFAARGEIAEIFNRARPLGEEGVRQIEHLLEVAVPRGEAQVFVEHRHTVGHIVEGDAQFGLGLADLVEQPRILNRDHRLGGEVLQQRNLLVGEWPNFGTVNHDVAEHRLVPAQGNE